MFFGALISKMMLKIL